LWLQTFTEDAWGPAQCRWAIDGGMLEPAVLIRLSKTLLIGPGERADVVIDFSNLAPGTVLTLMNDANAPYPDGDPVTEGTTDRIMQFIVNGEMVKKGFPKTKGDDKSQVPGKLRITPMVKLTDFAGATNITPDVTRQLTLNEVMGMNEEGEETGPLMVLLNNSRYEEIPDMPEMFGTPTEKPLEGTTEKWQLINTTVDAHPMHMHLVQFQLVSRQNFDTLTYMPVYRSSFDGGKYKPATGPPNPYDEINDDGAVGGNPAISEYLDDAIPANPNERGWKDVIVAYPGQVTTYMVRLAPTDLPLNAGKSKLLYSFDPSKGPGYVWHCHIVEHEDNDMMRPLNVQPSPVRSSTKSEQLIAENIVIDGYVLEQNAPNPFSTETEIKFSIPNDAHVRLTLYNSIGAEVKTLISAEAPAGNHTVRLSSDNLANGLYFYQLKAGLFTSTKTLIINR
jgi:FtsP/CotA-like multicopper oxidase with cupredoxin domain